MKRFAFCMWSLPIWPAYILKRWTFQHLKRIHIQKTPKKTILNKSASGSKTDPKSSALNQNTLGPIGFFFGRSAMWSNKENAVVQAAALLQALIAALQAVLLLCWRHGVGWTGTFCSVQNRLSPKYVEMRAMCGWTWTSMFWVESETRVQESGIKTQFSQIIYVKCEIFLKAPGWRHHLKQL